MFKMLIKILLFPVMVLLALCEAICAAVAHVSGIITHLIAGTFILAAILSCGFGLESWSVAVRMIIAGVIFLVLPMIGTILSAGFAFVNAWIRTM